LKPRKSDFSTLWRLASETFGKLKEMTKVGNFLLDLLFPAKCFGCASPKGKRNETGFLCRDCGAKIPVYSWLFCPVCHQKLVLGQPCPTHKYKTPLQGVGIVSDYQNPLLRQLIWSFKYEFLESLAEPLADLASHYFDLAIKPSGLAWREYLLLPIPLHKKRERWRGFNQAKSLAEKLAEKSGLTVVSGLERNSWHRPQMQISTRLERFKNISGAFSLAKGANFQNKDIILVDDVLTSGATLTEAAKTLKEAGAKSIFGLVLARG